MEYQDKLKEKHGKTFMDMPLSDTIYQVWIYVASRL